MAVNYRGGTTAQAPFRASSAWGILPGYSYVSDDNYNGDNYIKDPVTGKLSKYDEWRKNTRFAKESMNDGIASDSPITRKLAHWVNFDRFYTVDLEQENPSGRHYVFILRPDLYLIEDKSATEGSAVKLSKESRVNTDPYFIYLAEMHPEIIASLTGDFGSIGGSLSSLSYGAGTASGLGNAASTDGTRLNGFTLPIHTFIPYLTSRVESLQLPDFTLKDNSLVQPYTKYSIPYTQSGIESTTGGNVDIVFREDRDFSIHKLFYAWTYYQDKVMRDIFTPKKKYLLYNSIDYATSIYDFLVDETGENVIYWAKYTGCVPTNVPLSDLGFNKGNSPDSRVSISFKYFYCEHMDMNILRDFQYNSLGYVYMKSLKNSKSRNGFSVFKPCSLDDTEPMFKSDTFLGPALNGRPVLILMLGPDDRKYIKLRWLRTPGSQAASRTSNPNR
jgi:hypothetical protein